MLTSCIVEFLFEMSFFSRFSNSNISENSKVYLKIVHISNGNPMNFKKEHNFYYASTEYLCTHLHLLIWKCRIRVLIYIFTAQTRAERDQSKDKTFGKGALPTPTSTLIFLFF